jgi:hypothetical protein
MAEVATQETFSTGVIVERLVAIREERRRLNRLDSELSQSWRDLEALLINQMDAQGVTKASTDAGTATVSETVLPKVEDWDALYAHLKETDSLYLLQKRVSSAAFREQHEAGHTVPGITPFVQRSISLRKT